MSMVIAVGLVDRPVWHCHTLEHEDNEMMRPYLVV
jgi:FtsP/CotA-like multicopper oxidase with cupredoxin domain